MIVQFYQLACTLGQTLLIQLGIQFSILIQYEDIVSQPIMHWYDITRCWYHGTTCFLKSIRRSRQLLAVLWIWYSFGYLPTLFVKTGCLWNSTPLRHILEPFQVLLRRWCLQILYKILLYYICYYRVFFWFSHRLSYCWVCWPMISVLLPVWGCGNYFYRICAKSWTILFYFVEVFWLFHLCCRSMAVDQIGKTTDQWKK